MNPTRHPLHWPEGWKRTQPGDRTGGRFSKGHRVYGNHGSYVSRRELTVTEAIRRVTEELERIGIRDDDMIVSTNIRTRLDGLPRSGEPKPADPGVAVYWQPVGQPMRCMAIDRYDEVADNIAAIAATLEAMRAIERHGGAAILDRAFAGFTALPAPGAAKHWREVLGVGNTVQTAESLKAAYRRAASAAHPDKGGMNERMVEVNQAYAQGVKECGL